MMENTSARTRAYATVVLVLLAALLIFLLSRSTTLMAAHA